MFYLAAALIISLLVIIHEFGHYIVARAFGMRVVTFSIGFGPSLFRWRPRGSDTTFQVALIPVLAYVQIAGMNPREETDPNDRGSYQNATPIARFLTIAAGPLANFLAAGVLLFGIVAFGGEQVAAGTAQIARVAPNTPAAAAGLRADDTVRQINGATVRSWQDLVRATSESQGHPLNVVIDRAGQSVALTITPRMNPELRRYTIGVEQRTVYRPAPLSRAVEVGVVGPALATAEIFKQIGGMFRRTVPVQLVGPVGIVHETAQQAKHGWRQGMEWVAIISLQLFIFNLLPIPALDGGRLIWLGYEMATRRRPNPKVEARVLAASIMLMLGLFLIVTAREIWTGLMSLINRG